MPQSASKPKPGGCSRAVTQQHCVTWSECILARQQPRHFSTELLEGVLPPCKQRPMCWVIIASFLPFVRALDEAVGKPPDHGPISRCSSGSSVTSTVLSVHASTIGSSVCPENFIFSEDTASWGSELTLNPDDPIWQQYISGEWTMRDLDFDADLEEYRRLLDEVTESTSVSEVEESDKVCSSISSFDPEENSY